MDTKKTTARRYPRKTFRSSLWRCNRSNPNLHSHIISYLPCSPLAASLLFICASHYTLQRWIVLVHYGDAHVPVAAQPRRISRQRLVLVEVSNSSNPTSLGDSDRLGGGEYLVAPSGTGLTVAAEGSFGSAELPPASCMLGAWRCCWVACRVVRPGVLERGCPRETRPSCPRRRHLRRHCQVLAHSSRPRGSQHVGRRDLSVGAYLDEVLALWLCDEWLQLGGGEGVDEASL